MVLAAKNFMSKVCAIKARDELIMTRPYIVDYEPSKLSNGYEP